MNQVINVNSEGQETTEAYERVGHIKKYGSFLEFLHSGDCGIQGVPVTDLSSIGQAPPLSSFELYSRLQQVKHKHDSLIEKNAEIEKRVADIVAKRQELVKSIMKAKTEKEGILSSITSTPTEPQIKKLGELSITIEANQRQAENFVRAENDLRRQEMPDTDLKEAKDACVLAEKAFLKAVAAEIKAFIFASRELKWLWACYAKTTSKTFLRDILKDCFPVSGNTLEYNPNELEAILKDILEFYATKEAK